MATEQKVIRTALDSEQMCVLTSVYFQISCLYFQISCLTNHSLLQLSCSTSLDMAGWTYTSVTTLESGPCTNAPSSLL